MQVIKVSGQLLEDQGKIQDFVRFLNQVPKPFVLVHGGGPRIDEVQQAMGLAINKIDGLRVTDSSALQAALMVLCGEINKSLVAAMAAQGIQALGLSGVDGPLFQVEKLKHPEHDLGFVGEIVEVNEELLDLLLATGLTLVIAPLALGPQGQIFNVNADQVASALAGTVGASELQLLSKVTGVHIDGQVVKGLNSNEAEQMIEAGEINGGMIPKVRSGIEALMDGVARVTIASPEGALAGIGTSLYLEGKE